MAAFNPQSLLLLEQPLAKVPHEQLRKAFRSTQRNFERDFVQLTSSASDISQLSAEGEGVSAQQSATIALDVMISRVETLKKRLVEAQQNVVLRTEPAMRERTDSLATFESLNSFEEPGYKNWAAIRMDRWLVDYMLRIGRFSSATKHSHAKCIDALVDVPVFMEIHRVISALQRHSCSEALSWCNENKAALRKAKSTLEFDLRMQEFIELVRGGKFLAAIAYSKKHLSPWHDIHPAQFRQAMALLAYGSHMPKNSTYRKLYDVERWEALAATFTRTAYSLVSLPLSPTLSLALYAGLSALKHPTCGLTHGDGDEETGEDCAKNQDCPVCDTAGLGALARHVPRSQHINSTLVCHLSGKIIDDNNPPMAFRNGYVYSRQALEEMAALNGGRVTCPRTMQQNQLSDLRKVFVT